MKTSNFLPSYIRNFSRKSMDVEERRKHSDIIFLNLAYRPRPETVAAGGPNGVLRVQEELLGSHYRGFSQRYHFQPLQMEMPKSWVNWVQREGLGTMSYKLVEADYFVRHVLSASLGPEYTSRPENLFHFICHDIGSAAGVYFSGYPFSLVYHQQGGFIHERTSFGEALNEAERHVMNAFEKIAFENADRVYFPSKGAKQALLDTTEVVDASKVNFATEPLYNTVVDFDVAFDEAELFLVSHGYSKLLDPEIRAKYLIFISVGDYTKNKGIDRCPDALSCIAKLTNKKILWIMMGSKHKSNIYADLKAKAPSLPIETILVPSRQAHDLAMGLVQFSDWLFMLQRYSIFDFSTLEALKLGTGVILSPVGGNLEFNVNSNILYLDPDCDDITPYQSIVDASPEEYGKKNKSVYENHFSPKQFVASYRRVYDDVITRQLSCEKEIRLGTSEQVELKSLFRGKKVIVCGAGRSASRIVETDHADKVLVALNSALLMDLPFAVHVMQDTPLNARFWPEYIKKDVKRVYGEINRRATSHLKLDFEFIERVSLDCIRYPLSEFVFDEAHDELTLRASSEPIFDMKGVLFSALQLIARAGAESIELAGVDFSAMNFDGLANPNKYNFATLGNLKIMKKCFEVEGVPLSILYTDSVDVEGIFSQQEDSQVALSLEAEFEGLSPFRILQKLGSEGRHEEVLAYVQQEKDIEFHREPRFLREIAQAHLALEQFEDAHLYFRLFFKEGGKSKYCQKQLEKLASGERRSLTSLINRGAK